MKRTDSKILSNIKYIYFDFFNTLAEFYPPREELQANAAASLGIKVDPLSIRSAYSIADAFMGRENTRYPLAKRASKEVALFWADYEQLLLTTAGINITKERAGLVFEKLATLAQRFILFDDVAETLKYLKSLGLSIGLISNMNQDLSAIIDELGISLYIDCVATSGMAGAAKPDRALFRYALDLISARPEQAAHVGDDYEGDVLGAVNAGMLPILIDREQKIKNQDENIISITSLNQLKQIFI